MDTTPTVHLENDWSAKGAANSESEQGLPPPPPERAEEEVLAAILRSEDGGSLAGHEDSFLPGETGSLNPAGEQQWLQQLAVAGFDRRLAACFCEVDHRTDGGAPVGRIEEETVLEEDP